MRRLTVASFAFRSLRTRRVACARFEAALSSRQRHRRKHRLRVVRQVPAGEIHLLPRDVRRLHAHVAGGELGFLRELFQFLDERRAFRQPERQAGADVVVDGEQPHLRADLAMVALLRLLEHREVGLQLGLVLERGAVDALELRILFVALVVGAGDVGELERADVARAHHVRPGAEIDEVAVAKERNLARLGNVLEDVELELARLRPLAQRRRAARSCRARSPARATRRSSRRRGSP